ASNQLTEWPVLTLESDYSGNNDITSSRNTIIPIRIKNENNNLVDPRPSTSKYGN
uniref:Uncharacterized protein n=1 Tax=Meloidogyne javanica TaxID=6303 RepID=A0A915MJY4_MELJA